MKEIINAVMPLLIKAEEEKAKYEAWLKTYPAPKYPYGYHTEDCDDVYQEYLEWSYENRDQIEGLLQAKLQIRENLYTILMPDGFYGLRLMNDYAYGTYACNGRIYLWNICDDDARPTCLGMISNRELLDVVTRLRDVMR